MGGKLNVSVNCLDRHLDGASEEQGRARLGRGARRPAHAHLPRALPRGLQVRATCSRPSGVRKGDRVTLYMPMIPELPDRDARLRADRGDPLGRLRRLLRGVAERPDQRPGGEGPRHGRRRLAARQRRAPEADRGRGARRKRPSIEHVVVVRRTGCAGRLRRGARPLVARPDGGRVGPPARPRRWTRRTRSTSCTPPARPASPRASSTPPAGYLVGAYATSKWIFDLKDDDVYWCTADIGWVTGHSYVVYGPLANGATCLMYEGAPDTPARDRFWDLIERHGVTILYTAPTAIRAFMKWGTEWPEEARPLLAAPARIGRRADQSRGLDVVPGSTSAAEAARSSTRGGRPRPG